MTLHETAARRALPLLDLTRLEKDGDVATVEALCRRAVTPYGSVAAVCVYPEFIPAARRILDGSDPSGAVRIATVVNFPEGQDPEPEVVAAIEAALDAGADEIDLVFPWRELEARGDADAGRAMVRAARDACGKHPLKVILETGSLRSPELIRKAAAAAIEAGADFLKTATGKAGTGATPEAVRILLESVREAGRDVGCKVSGGVSTTEQALEYLRLAEAQMGADWIGPRHLRFGASGLLDDLLGQIGGTRCDSERPGVY